MKLYNFSLVIITFFITSFLFSQTTVRGHVKTITGEPIFNASVYLDSLKTNVKTNRRGNFKIIVPEDVKVIGVFANGYGFLATEYKNEKRVTIIFVKKSNQTEDDLVQLGYGVVKDEDTAVKVDKLDMENDKNTVAFTNIYDYIRGRVAGVKVTSDNRIIIRGISTLTGNTDPLFVVDGVIMSSIDHILPQDVKSINVLKGHAASIYGSRGANGVIQIKLKD